MAWNFSGIDQVYSNQIAWNQNTHSCGRPAADLGLAVICNIFDNGKNMDVGTALNVYQECCPVDHNKTNIWIAEKTCSVFCYTSNATIFENFDKCVVAIGKGAGNDTDVRGNCGYIDYAALKRGVTSGATLQRRWTFSLLAGMMISAMFTAL